MPAADQTGKPGVEPPSNLRRVEECRVEPKVAIHRNVGKLTPGRVSPGEGDVFQEANIDPFYGPRATPLRRRSSQENDLVASRDEAPGCVPSPRRRSPGHVERERRLNQTDSHLRGAISP